MRYCIYTPGVNTIYIIFTGCENSMGVEIIAYTSTKFAATHYFTVSLCTLTTKTTGLLLYVFCQNFAGPLFSMILIKLSDMHREPVCVMT